MRTAAAVVVVLMLVGCGGGGGGGESDTTQQAGELCFGLNIHGDLGWDKCENINQEYDGDGLWDPPSTDLCFVTDSRGVLWQVACSK